MAQPASAAVASAGGLNKVQVPLDELLAEARKNADVVGAVLTDRTNGIIDSIKTFAAEKPQPGGGASADTTPSADAPTSAEEPVSAQHLPLEDLLKEARKFICIYEMLQ